MDYKKIGALIVKDFYSIVPCHLLYGEYGNKVGVTDKHRLFLIPKEKFPFDLETLLDGRQQFHVKECIPKESDYVDAVLTGNKKRLDKATVKDVVEISNGTYSVWVNEALLKEYGKYCTFKINDYKEAPKRPVLIYEDEELVGLVLPVNLQTYKES